ncbi:pyridoxamine 5'-phosphate oxidase family protein [Clostridiaceae bacterium M8S5]|nr:pyridoxamine 5'-phosphate oxidase family protein [Clostridiaceae bacterium M8S5]
MFKEMRKKGRQVCDEQIEEILKKGEYGTMATISENGYPYVVPLNYVYCDNSIYFHCAKEGHKLEDIKRNNNVSFNVVIDTEILSEKYTTLYKSVTLFGQAKEIKEVSNKREILVKLLQKYMPDKIKDGMKNTEDVINKALTIIKIDIEHVTGKANS